MPPTCSFLQLVGDTGQVLAYRNRLFAASTDMIVTFEALEGAAAFGTPPTHTPSHRLRIVVKRPV